MFGGRSVPAILYFLEYMCVCIYKTQVLIFVTLPQFECFTKTFRPVSDTMWDSVES